MTSPGADPSLPAALILVRADRRRHGDVVRLIDVMNGARPTKVIHNARFERRVLAVGIAIDGVFDTLGASRRAGGSDALGLGVACALNRGKRSILRPIDHAAPMSHVRVAHWVFRPFLDGGRNKSAARPNGE